MGTAAEAQFRLRCCPSAAYEPSPAVSNEVTGAQQPVYESNGALYWVWLAIADYTLTIGYVILNILFA